MCYSDRRIPVSVAFSSKAWPTVSGFKTICSREERIPVHNIDEKPSKRRVPCFVLSCLGKDAMLCRLKLPLRKPLPQTRQVLFRHPVPFRERLASRSFHIHLVFVRIFTIIALVFFLCRIEGSRRHNLGYNRLLESFAGLERLLRGFGGPTLLVRMIKDRRSVGRASVIELSARVPRDDGPDAGQLVERPHHTPEATASECGDFNSLINVVNHGCPPFSSFPADRRTQQLNYLLPLVQQMILRMPSILRYMKNPLIQ